MHKLIITALLATVAFGAQAQTGNRLTDNGSGGLLRADIDDARKNQKFGIQLNQLEGEKCVRDMSAPGRQSFDQLPSYDCQVWYYRQKTEGLFSVYSVVPRDQYAAWHDDVSRIRLVAKKLKDLAVLQSWTKPQHLPPLIAAGVIPQSMRATLNALAAVPDLPAQLKAAESAQAKAERLNPLLPKRQSPTSEGESLLEREARLLGTAPSKPVAPAKAEEPETSAELSARTLAAYQALPALAAPTHWYDIYLDISRTAVTQPSLLSEAIDKRIVAPYRLNKTQLSGQWAVIQQRDRALHAAGVAWLRQLQAEPNCAQWVTTALDALARE